MHSYSSKACASGIINFQLHLDFDDLCLKEIETLKINGLTSTFDQTKENVTSSGPKCSLLKPRHKLIKKSEVTESFFKWYNCVGKNTKPSTTQIFSIRKTKWFEQTQNSKYEFVWGPILIE